MKVVESLDQIESMVTKGAVFILFGGPDCGVCKVLRPQLDILVKEDFPEMESIYVDCEKSPETCAQYGVFSLPVVKVYIEGMLVFEVFGSFSLKQLADSLERPYSMWLGSR